VIRSPANLRAPVGLAVLAASLPGVAFAASSAQVVAAAAGGRSAAGSAGSLSPTWFVVMASVSLLPFLLLMLTSFVKISVVLSILKSALGSSQIPPTSIVTGLAMILSVYVMAPTGERIYQAIQQTAPAAAGTGSLVRAETLDGIADLVDRGKEPLRDFLLKAASTRDRETFATLAVQMRAGASNPPTITNRDFVVVAPAFVTSELRRAFEMGFLLFLPFLIVDLVIANLLVALGMQALNPTTVSLPFKLLLFVLVDGWHLVARGLVQSYL